MPIQRTSWVWGLALLAAWGLAGCASTAAGIVSADPAQAAQVQADQYQRDAEATGTARAVQLSVDMANIAATAGQATQQAVVMQATLNAGATQDTALQIANATATAVYEQEATQTAAAQGTATAVANLQSTQVAQLEATRQSLEVTAEQAKVQQDTLVHSVTWILILLVSLLAVGLLTYLALVGIQALRKRLSLVTHGPFNSPLLILDGPHGQQIIVDPQRLFGAATVIDPHGNLIAPELAHPLLQDRATSQAQLVELQRAAHNPFQRNEPARQRVGMQTQGSQEMTQASGWAKDAPEPSPTLELDAPWQLMHSWLGGGLPLGVSEGGLLLVDPDAFPHFLFAGTTGSGKTRFGLRPLITAALADSWHVSIFDKSGLDFVPFQQHPNASVVVLRHPADAVDYLSALYEVVEARFEWMRNVGATTWGRAPGRNKPPRVLAVFDEFSNLADSMDTRNREELWRWARMVAAEGRKAGVHLALALQDPTHRSIDLRIRRNCVPLSFRVKDSEASRVVLGAGGAEVLAPRHFMTVLHTLTQAVAFAPDDDQITTFLANRRVTIYPKPEWVS